MKRRIRLGEENERGFFFFRVHFLRFLSILYSLSESRRPTSPKIPTYLHCDTPCCFSLAGIELRPKFGLSQEEIETACPAARGMVLKVSRPEPASTVVIAQSNAILRALAEAKPDSMLYGRTEFQSAEVGDEIGDGDKKGFNNEGGWIFPVRFIRYLCGRYEQKLTTWEDLG